MVNMNTTFQSKAFDMQPPHFDVLIQYKPMTQKAGAIVRNKKGEVLLVYRQRTNDWTFPKGHVESGETAAEATVREVKEETGLDVAIVKPLPNHFYLSPFEGEVATAMFLAEPTDPQQGLRIERDGDALRWVPMNDVTKTLSYENLQTYFQRCVDDEAL